MLERELAENLLAQSRSIIEALNLILLDVKPGDCSREIYDRLRLRVGHAIGAVIQLKQLVYEPYPEMNELANLKLAEVEGNAEQRIEILLPASVSPPPQNLDFAYASRIQAHGLNAIRELYVPALEAVFDSDELIEVKRSFGRIIGRIQEILEVVVKVYPELDDLRDQT